MDHSLLLEVEKTAASTERLLERIEQKRPFLPISIHTPAAEKQRLTALKESPETRLLIATSGSTGSPKILTHTYESYFSRLTLPSFIQSRYPRKCRVGIILPLYTIGGLTAFLTAHYSDQSILFLQNRHELIRAILEGSIDQCTLTPAHLFFILEALEKEGRHPPHPIKLLVGAAPLTADLAQRAAAYTFEVQIAYGMSEIPSITIDGIPSENVEISIDHGEITLQSPYLANHIKGVFRTGDCGFFSEGKLIVTGRLGPQICVGGLKIDPVEIETVAALYPSVLTAHLRSLPDPALGWKTELIITPLGECNLTDLKIHLEKHLHPKKIPALISLSPKSSGWGL